MVNEYAKYSDEELIVQLRDGDHAITDYIMEKYKNLVRSKAQSMYILGADREDLIQEGMIGLFKAIRDYDTGRDASFFTFADLCVSRQMYTAIQAAGRLKNVRYNHFYKNSVLQTLAMCMTIPRAEKMRQPKCEQAVGQEKEA